MLPTPLPCPVRVVIDRRVSATKLRVKTCVDLDSFMLAAAKPCFGVIIHSGTILYYTCWPQINSLMETCGTVARYI